MPLVDPRPDEHLWEGSEQALQPAPSRLLAETPELMMALLNDGADPNFADKHGQTPLHLASGLGYALLEAVQFLCTARADVDKLDNNGWTPQVIAAQEGHEAIVRALLDASTDKEQSSAFAV